MKSEECILHFVREKACVPRARLTEMTDSGIPDARVPGPGSRSSVQMNPHHALFVTFHVPPEASSSGVLRTLKYVRYLDDLGWRVTLVSISVSAYEATDPALEAQLPASCRIIRTRYLNTKRHLSLARRYPAILALPDVWIGWLPWAVAAARRLFLSDPFELVYSTSPPATAHLIAQRIARRTRVPWVADFRDPWFEVPPEPGAPNGPLFRRLDRMLERKVVESCDAVVTTTADLCDMLAQRYPKQPASKFTAILNGYDEADFAALPREETRADAPLVIVHSGTINAEFRNPIPFFAAVHRCIDAGVIEPNRLRVKFLGGGSFAAAPGLQATVKRLGLEEIVEFVPRLPYAESLREVARADLLLLLQSSPDTSGLVPAKLYEYLRAGKPVIALVPQGATQQILSVVGGGEAIAPEDSEGLYHVVAENFRRWALGTLSDNRADFAALRRYDRRALTAELARLFEELLARTTTLPPESRTSSVR